MAHHDCFTMAIEDCGEEYEVAVEFSVESHNPVSNKRHGDRQQTQLEPHALNSADEKDLPPGLYERHEERIHNACWEHLHSQHDPRLV